MALQLLLGGSGYGKSRRMYQSVIEKSLAYPEKNFFIIVPEQYTMQVQKNIVMMHPDHVTANIDVVSFGRLAYRIFDELGVETLTILDDIGKSMVLRRVIGEKLASLKFFQGNVRKEGFVSEMKSVISELLQYHVEPEKLQDMADRMEKRPILTGKLHDVGMIYEGFLSYIAEKYMTTEGILDHLTALVPRSSLIARSEFYLDEFTGFTPSQYALIGELLKYGLGMQIALTVDPQEDIYTPGKSFQLFYLTKETIYKLNRLCAQLHMDREDDIVLHQCRRFSSRSALGILERGLYRRRKIGSTHQDTVYDQNISCLVMRTPMDELQTVAGKILELCHGDLRYRDIALITGDLSVYGHLAESVFTEAGIPFFIDQKKDVLSNRLAEFMRALLEVLIQDFSYDSVFRFLKTGLTDISMTDIHRLENYVLATGIRGAGMWSKPFVRRYKGISEGELEYVNDIRLQVHSWLMPLKEKIDSGAQPAGVYSEVLLAYMEQHQLEQRIEQMTEDFKSRGEFALAKEYEQIYKVIEDILERMKEILRDEQMSLNTYAQILDAGLREAKVGIIPPGMDQVMIGDLRRSRLNGVKVLFFVGINEGLVPGTVRDGGLITDRDREILSENEMELAPTGKEDAYTERFYIYSMMTKPTEHLYLSYAKTDSHGKSLRPSSLIDRVLKLLPGTEVCDVESDDGLQKSPDHLYGRAGIMQYITRGLNAFKDKKTDPFWLDLYAWMMKQKDYGDIIVKMTDQAFFCHTDDRLSKAGVQALYGDILINSVTTLEKYAACAYAHFLAYGLVLKERPRYRIEAPDLGNLFHKALELFSKRLTESEFNWHNVPDELRDDLAARCVRDVTADEHHMILYDNYRNQFLVYRLNRMVKRTIWALQKQIQKGSFEPDEYELRFDSGTDQGTLDFDLSENEVMRLKGTIDRLDKYEDDDHIYVKIVDYKSGSKRFDAAALYYGLQLQLVVYMEAAMARKADPQTGKKVIPAGILYYNINDPMISIDEAFDDSLSKAAQQEVIETEILKNLRMNGLVNSDLDIIRLMDRDIDGQSEVIPAAINKDGSLAKSSSAIPNDTFEKLFRFTSGKVQEIGEHILQGRIEMNPYEKDRQNRGCDYCPYQPVCGFDETLDGYAYRKLKKMSKDEAWIQICRKGEQYGRDMDRGTEAGD